MGYAILPKIKQIILHGFFLRSCLKIFPGKVNQISTNPWHFPGTMEKQLPAFWELFFFYTPQFCEFHKQDLFPEIVETHYGLQVIAGALHADNHAEIPTEKDITGSGMKSLSETFPGARDGDEERGWKAVSREVVP